MSDEEEEYDKFGEALEKVQREMKKGFPVGQVSGWDDDAQGIEEERNPVGKFYLLRTADCHGSQGGFLCWIQERRFTKLPNIRISCFFLLSLDSVSRKPTVLGSLQCQTEFI
jgi:hypothetical protein